MLPVDAPRWQAIEGLTRKSTCRVRWLLPMSRYFRSVSADVERSTFPTSSESLDGGAKRRRAAARLEAVRRLRPTLCGSVVFAARSLGPKHPRRRATLDLIGQTQYSTSAGT